jgi:hypothetical protein
MVCVVEQGQPCSQKTPKKHQHLQEGLDEMNEE